MRLQVNAVGNEDLSEHLNEAASRVNAVGRAYERLAYTADYEKIELIEYLRERVIKDLGADGGPPAQSSLKRPKQFSLPVDRAILVGLIITEFVSNAGKVCLSR